MIFFGPEKIFVRLRSRSHLSYVLLGPYVTTWSIVPLIFSHNPSIIFLCRRLDFYEEFYDYYTTRDYVDYIILGTQVLLLILKKK